ncbi:hypothetical protein [Methanoculleus caldifontis]|nr:hypothetical protein [Methanoculleus sp. Wushi-C6]
MHVLAKLVKGDPLFNTLGALIIGTGVFVFVSMLLYACGFLT